MNTKTLLGRVDAVERLLRTVHMAVDSRIVAEYSLSDITKAANDIAKSISRDVASDRASGSAPGL